ncbi:talin-1 isoform X1 [Lingula anatina]|uniref:Talin-1 isoform X1 n=2 Tax=Lingula anatina TaxID=7574 RepID=A0A1S3HJY6_LINAN|nr:talin-1 isoform X1 [Lingula anatina]XP_013386333.1 talin-1 isoform X1 [Lingula anatina]|eukprot:XP_013386332.1 talin-1 isoform X1 [Lingula anatina]
MATLSLKVSIVGSNIVKTMQFEPSTIIYDACRMIRERIQEANQGNPADYGLFLADEDPKKGVWLEQGRTLEYYLLRNGDLLEYKKKQRILRVRMLDGTVKTLQVDDSHTLGQLMVTICTRIGVTNHDEFSLVRDLSEEEKEKTLTLRRGQSLARDQKKLDELKKKLHTDDELNWLDHSKSLREEGVEENETLLLRRKFFFSDQNVDARDPVQLNLLYVQSRDGILNGTHPVTQEEAVQFGGIQCQIQFGDHNEQKHKSGFLELKEFLPKEYMKIKGIEKKIFAEHRKLIGSSEIDAKVRYCSLCRSLKTYGITFFLVKEKMKGKNKLVPRLLGITKDSVVRVDEKTKEILKTWPLTTVRRWAASPNSFTLDFGDYSDSYYSVQTTEGEQISQLIAGYIDIILKKKKAKDHLGIEGDEESTMLEESVSPAKATIIQHQSSKTGQAVTGNVAMPAVLRAGGQGQAQFSHGSMQQPQYGKIQNQFHQGHAPPAGQNAQMQGMSHAQRGLWSSMNSAITDIETVEGSMHQRAELPPLGPDHASKKWKENALDVSKHHIGSQLSAMNAATAQVVTMTSGGPDDTDYTAVGSAVSTITANMTEFAKDVRMLAALQESDEVGDNLLDAARRLAGAFSDLLKAAQPGSSEPRQNLLTAASKIGEASNEVMKTAGDGTDEVDKAFQDALLALAKAVANATAALVLKAKGVASKCDDQALQNRVISSATQCALATSQLVACTKVVAPTVSNPACQEQLVEAAKLVAKSVEGIVETAQTACKDDRLLQELGAAATAVTKALNDLLQHIKQGSGGGQGGQQEVAVEAILGATDRLFSSMGDAPEMVRQARVLAQATSQLVNAIKGQAEGHSEPDMQKRLLAAAKVLADATARMVEAAKGCASNPNDSSQQQHLKAAAEDLRSATNKAASNALKKKLIKTLEVAAKQAASAATQLINASQAAEKSNRNPASQNQLNASCKSTADEIPKLVQGIRGTLHSPDSPTAQLNLINASEDMIQVSSRLVNSAKAATPTVSDQATALSLTNATKNMSAALAELRTAAAKAQEACGTLEIDGALAHINDLERELEEIEQTCQAGKLLPLPGETMESSALQLGHTSKTVGSSMAQLLTAAAQGNENYTGIAAKDTANALGVLTNAVRGVAACSDDRKVQQNIIDAARDVMDKSARLIEEAKRAVSSPNSPDNQQRLAQVAKAVSHALNNCVNCLPGQRDVDAAIKEISSMSQTISSGQFPHTDKSFSEVQNEMSAAANNLNQATTDVVAAAQGTPQQLASASNSYSKSYSELVNEGMTFAGMTKEREVQSQIVSGLKSVSMVSSKLLLAAKSLSADPNAPNARNLLSQAARAVTDSINQLIDICTTSAPGQKECDNALRQIQVMHNVLDNPTEPVSDASYFDCVDSVMEKSKALGDSMLGITDHAKRGALEEFCGSVKQFAGSVCGLTEAAAQAAYLVGISDRASEPGKPGLVDQSQFSRANQAIQMACETLTDPSSTQQQVLSAATVVAKHTSALCNICRVASSKTTNPVAKRHFVQSAKDVANSTANLVKAIKALDSDFSEQNRKRCADAAKPLIGAVEELTTFASSPEFTSVPAKISREARKAQEPIISSGKAMIDGACHMVKAAKQLAAHPKDPPTYLLYSNHSKSVSDAIKSLVAAMKESAPGQKECDDAIEKVTSTIKDLDQAALAAISNSLPARNDNNQQGFQQQMISCAQEIADRIDPVRTAGKGEAEKLGHLVTNMASYLDPLADAAVGTASKIMNSKRQMAVLDQTKTVAESALQLIYVAKEGAGNPKSNDAHTAIDDAADNMKEVMADLLQTMEEASATAGVVTAMVDNLGKAIAKTDDRIVVHENLSFVDYQTNMVRLAKKIAQIAQDMVGKSSNNPEELGGLGNQLTREYGELASESQGATSCSSTAEIGHQIKRTVQDLGRLCIELVQDAGHLQSSPGDSFAKRDLVEHARAVSEKVSHVLAALQAGARGTQACINAAHTVSGIIGDLDTTIMFATAGTLNPDADTEQFADHREAILKTAKALVEDTKTLVAGAAANQEQLAGAAQSAVRTITRLTDVVKFGAASLGSEQPEAQVLLINAVKDVASALADLISCTKNAAGKPVQDPSMSNLKDSAKTMVTNVTSLLKTVKTVEDEAARGTRALESTIEGIAQEIRAYESSDKSDLKATPEDLIRHTKAISNATAKAVAAGNSGRQEDIIVAANMGRKAVFDILVVCKAAAQSAETEEIKHRTLRSGRDCAHNFRELLDLVHLAIQKPTYENKQSLGQASKKVANAVTEIVQSAEAIKGTEWVDPDDPTVIAENELLTAANSIEAAAKKLAALKPRQPAKRADGSQEADESLNFEEQILEAARSIAAATAALVKAAGTAQKELVLQGKVTAAYRASSFLDEDGQWSQGLISAAKMVAAATHNLCEAANSMVQGNASEEKLISSAKQVASSTAQLLVACKVKADTDSVSMQRLQGAGNAVKRATEALVRAAQQAKELSEEEQSLTINKRMVGGMAQIIMAQEEIIRKEKELEAARSRLAMIRKEKYKDNPPEETDAVW